MWERTVMCKHSDLDVRNRAEASMATVCGVFLCCVSSEAKLSEKTAMQVVPFEPSLQVAVHVEKVKRVAKE